MNIFVLDTDTKLAAQYHCDKHVVKMVLESAQLLCSAHNMLDGTQPDLYKLTHKNHPCAIWTRESNNNYNWLYSLFCELCKEYTFRYKKVHLCETKFLTRLSCPPKNISIGHKTLQPFCMPDEYKIANNIVDSYRNYYLKDKIRFAVWNKTREQPNWWRN